MVEAYSEKPALLNMLIIALTEDSLHFEDIVEICAREKLFQSLTYICSVNGDFISPANKIVAHLQAHPGDTEQYANLKRYLRGLIQLRYPNGKPVTEHAGTMLAELGVYLSCGETLGYMVSHYARDYFELLAGLSERMLEFDLVNEIPSLVNHVLEQLEVIAKEGLLYELARFTITVGLSPKIHYSK